MKSVIQIFTELLSVSGIVAAFGYMELRAHWTYLGVSALPGIGVERYLMEAYAFAGAMLVPVTLAAFALLAVVSVGVRIRKKLSGTKVEGSLRSAARWIPGAVLAALIAGEIALFGAISGPVAVAVGPLETAAKQGQRGLGSLVLVLGLILIGTIALVIARPLQNGIFKWSLIAFAVTVLVQTSTLYGRNVRSAVYPAARVITTAAQPETHLGLILLQTGDALEMWIPGQHTGRIVVIPAGAVARIDLGRGLDLFETAADLVAGQTAGALEKKAGL